MRAMQSEYMYWAKTQTPVRYALGSSEVPHFSARSAFRSTSPISSSMARAAIATRRCAKRLLASMM